MYFALPGANATFRHLKPGKGGLRGRMKRGTGLDKGRVLHTVSDEAAKVTAYNAMPCWALALIELLYNLCQPCDPITRIKRSPGPSIVVVQG